MGTDMAGSNYSKRFTLLVLGLAAMVFAGCAHPHQGPPSTFEQVARALEQKCPEVVGKKILTQSYQSSKWITYENQKAVETTYEGLPNDNFGLVVFTENEFGINHHDTYINHNDGLMYGGYVRCPNDVMTVVSTEELLRIISGRP